MRVFSFIHAADLHLGAPFRGLSLEADAGGPAELMRSSTTRAFRNLVRLAVRERVDFVLLAGDVYDGREPGLRTLLEFRDGLARLREAGVAVYVVHGNHDPSSGPPRAVDWPENVRFFGPEPESVIAVEEEGKPLVAVSGVSFAAAEETRNLAALLPRCGDVAFHVGLLHCNVGGDPAHGNYAPCGLDDLRGRGVSYWALGHVHEHRVLCRDPWVVYPGSIQGLSVREPGEHGCCLVRVDEDGRVDLRFAALDAARWRTLTVDVGGMETLDVLERRALQAIGDELAAAAGRDLLCRLRLHGRGPLYRELRRGRGARDLLERLRERLAGGEPRAWVQDLELDLRPPVDLAERAGEGDLLAEILLLAEGLRADERGLENLFRQTLSPLWDKRWAGAPARALPLEFPSAEEMRAILQEAELLCLDELEGGE